MIAPGTLFEYLPSYSRVAFRHGRFQIVKVLRKAGSSRTAAFDLYETIELSTGDTRNYDEAQIKSCGKRLPIAVSQLWCSLSGGKTFTLSRCWQDQGDWFWEYDDADGAKGFLSEATLIQHFARVDGLDESPAAAISAPPNGRCTSCGHPAFVMSLSVECTNRQCRFFVASA